MSRLEKVNHQLKREIGRIIQQELSDPRLELVTVIEVKTSSDLRNARVFFSVLGDEKKLEDVQKGLNGASGMIRRILGSELNMRYTPEIKFSFDNSLQTSARLEAALKEINEETGENK